MVLAIAVAAAFYAVAILSVAMAKPWPSLLHENLVTAAALHDLLPGGILSTIAVPLTPPLDDVLAPWRERYAQEPFVEIADATPALRDVVFRNTVRISATMARGTRAPMVIVTSAIDNLMKGAAGQAIQNANVMLGLDETAGLCA